MPTYQGQLKDAEIDAIIPDIVGIVACDTPAADVESSSSNSPMGRCGLAFAST